MGFNVSLVSGLTMPAAFPIIKEGMNKLKKLLSRIGYIVTGFRKRLKIILVIGAWLIVVTIFLAFGL